MCISKIEYLRGEDEGATTATLKPCGGRNLVLGQRGVYVAHPAEKFPMWKGRTINAVEQQLPFHKLLNICLCKRDGKAVQQHRKRGLKNTDRGIEHLLNAVHMKSKHPERGHITQPNTASSQPVLVIPCVCEERAIASNRGLTGILLGELDVILLHTGNKIVTFTNRYVSVT